MFKVADYHKHAAECRALAARMARADQRDQLLRMAEAWEKMAEERARLLLLEDAGLVPTR